MYGSTVGASAVAYTVNMVGLYISATVEVLIPFPKSQYRLTAA